MATAASPARPRVRASPAPEKLQADLANLQIHRWPAIKKAKATVVPTAPPTMPISGIRIRSINDVDDDGPDRERHPAASLAQIVDAECEQRPRPINHHVQPERPEDVGGLLVVGAQEERGYGRRPDHDRGHEQELEGRKRRSPA